MSVRIVMVETTHPGNIGATARVMANMGLTQLCLVSPRSFPDPAATARAAGSDYILEQAKVFDSLGAAVSDCGCVIGATARRRSLTWPLLDAEQAAARSQQWSLGAGEGWRCRDHCQPFAVISSRALRFSSPSFAAETSACWKVPQAARTGSSPKPWIGYSWLAAA